MEIEKYTEALVFCNDSFEVNNEFRTHNIMPIW